MTVHFSRAIRVFFLGLMGALILSTKLLVAVDFTATSDAPPADPKAKYIANEIKFAQELVKRRWLDYAEKVVKKLTDTYPDAKGQVGPVRIEMYTAWGKFDEAEKQIASMPSNSVETMSMKLALGDAYYVRQKMAKARELYEAFFKQYPNGPPPELKTLYGESAYKFAQMLLLKGDLKGAVQAYRYVLLSKPETGIERGIQMEMAELLFRLGAETTDAKERAVYFKECAQISEKIQWSGQDEKFGKTVVLLSHIKVIEGKKDEARKIINDYMGILKSIDDYIKENGLPLKMSPMAECKYLLGTLYEEDGRKLYEQKNEAEALKLLQSALGNYMTVYSKYSSSSWAAEAGNRLEDLVKYLESKGRKVQLPKVDRTAIIEAQFKEAKLMFADNQYKEAAEKYLEVLSVYLGKAGSITALGELAQCYIRDGDMLYGRAIAGFIAERYSRDRDPARVNEAANTLLVIIAAYEEEGHTERANELYKIYFTKFPTQEKTPFILFKFAENFYRKEKYADAVDYYSRITTDYPKSRIYVDALNRLSYSQDMIGDVTNAAVSFATYCKELQPGPAKVNATLRLAECYFKMGQIVSALNEYARVINYLNQESAKYAPTPDDVSKTRKALERAMYMKPVCYSQLKKPEDMVPQFRMKAIEGYNDFLKVFPKSEQAPRVLSSVGTLNYVMNNAEEAGKAYERLAREFPDSEQAKNILFAQGQSLLEIGQTKKAIEVFDKMFSNIKAYNPTQFMRVAQIMMSAQEYETARKSFIQARLVGDKDRPIWEPASMGLGEALLGLNKPAEAVVPIEELLSKYKNTGYTVSANVLLGKAYVEAAKAAVEQAKKDEFFAKAIAALNVVRKITRDAEVQAQIDIQLGDIQLLQGQKEAALASYQRVFLLNDTRVEKMRPAMELAFEKSLPLLQELNRPDDTMENCLAYIKAFPKGRLLNQARAWRDDLKRKGIKAPYEEEEIIPAPSPQEGAAAATNAVAPATTR